MVQKQLIHQTHLLKGKEIMSSNFCPVDELRIYCRFCEKIAIAQLDRSIAENGKTLDRNSTFEYYCTRCFKTFCFSGIDLLEQVKPDQKPEMRSYAPQQHFYIGEIIFHKQFNETGIIVGKDNGSPSKIVVFFEKNGLKRLIQDM
jgi:hypothetical protein